MNKYIKLILIFLSIIGVIVAVQFISDGGLGRNIRTDSESTFGNMSNKIHDEWHNQKEWNKELYKEHLELLDDRKRFGYLKKNEHDRLAESVCIEAIDKIYYAMTSEWGEKSCRRDYIKKQYSGVKEIEKSEYNKGAITQIKELNFLKSEYDKVNKFIDGTLRSKTMGASAVVDDTYGWKSFAGVAQKVRKKTSDCLSGRGYKTYFYKIDEIKNTLSNSESMIRIAADNYYKEVGENLKSSFDSGFRMAVADSDTLAVVELISKMAKTISDLKRECDEFSSSSYMVFKDYVWKKNEEFENYVR